MARLFEVCLSSAMAATTCLACNGSAAAHDRRVLTGTQVHTAWKEILALVVEHNERLASNVEGVEAAAAQCIGYVCRKCFALLDRYQKAKHSLLTNIKSVISSYGQHTVHVGSKRTIQRDHDDESVPTAKVRRSSEGIARRQLNFSQVDNQSPSVVVNMH